MRAAPVVPREWGVSWSLLHTFANRPGSVSDAVHQSMRPQPWNMEGAISEKSITPMPCGGGVASLLDQYNPLRCSPPQAVAPLPVLVVGAAS